MGLGQHAVAVAHQFLDAVVAERDAEVLVATSSSWCASSTTSVGQAGITSPNEPCRTAASAHSRWWFTMTTSDSAARWRISVTKQSL